MRKLIVEAEASLDGVMDGESADYWQQIFQYHSPDVSQYLKDLLFMPDALVMGRRTYEGFAEVWPTRQGEDADRINAMPKYVASRSLKSPLQWNSTLIQGDPAEAIRKLKQESGGNLLQYGIGDLTQALLKEGLVDEVRLVVFPFTYGKGARIFDNMGVHTMKLVDTQTFTSGAIALHYQPQPPA